MEKDFESWLHQRQPDSQFPNAKSLKLPFDLGMQNTGIPSATPCANAALPSFGFTGPPNFKTGQSKEPHGWFYCLPRFRQGLVPDSSTLHDNKFMGGLVPDSTLHDNKFIPEVDFPGKVSPDAGCGPKQFLVFDRTGNKTTLILSSMIGGASNHPPLNSWNQNKPKNVEGGEVGNGSDDGLQFHSGTVNLTDDLDNDDDDEISEMHEDSEDIDALLSSDCYSEDEDEDDEETSTGHSPIATITAYEEMKQDLFHENGDMDDVASSVGSTKRRKLSSTTYSTLKQHKGSSEYEDDAESSCIGPDHWVGLGPDRACTKRDRKEKIRETVSILKTILPVGGGGDGEDAVVVLDEAINYLKKLRYEAKSLGISGL